MAAPEDTRRYQVEAYANAHPDALWIVHPSGENEPEWRIEASTAELLHALPRSEPCPQVPPPTIGALYEITAAAGLKVRTTPDSANGDANRVGLLPLGTQVRATPHDATWLRIVEGEHAGRYIASAYARPT